MSLRESGRRGNGEEGKTHRFCRLDERSKSWGWGDRFKDFFFKLEEVIAHFLFMKMIP